MTTTGQWAFVVQCWLTEPRSMPRELAMTPAADDEESAPL